MTSSTMRVMSVSVVHLLLLCGCIDGHGQMNYPPSTRQGYPGKTWPGALSGQGSGGYCEQPDSQGHGNPLNGACMLFSQPSVLLPNISTIAGPPVLNDSKYRTNNVNITGGPNDWTAAMPWRNPGTASVIGSGCGSAGGGPVFNENGGWPPTGMHQGDDPIKVLPGPAGGPVTTWTRGSNATVAMGIWANHGGGYSYRLCKNDPGAVTESCFQKTQLKFAEDNIQTLMHINGTEYQIPMTKYISPVTGAEWVRVPFPTCASGGTPPNHGFTDGIRLSNGSYTCGTLGTEYPEPLLNGQKIGLFGFGYCNHTSAPNSCTADKYHDYNIVDQVIVPLNIPAGNYLLSWRWDCEQTHQIWQNCADVRIL